MTGGTALVVVGVAALVGGAAGGVIGAEGAANVYAIFH
jgi:hypothetical protein